MTKIFAIVGWILMGLLGIFLIWFGISFIDVVIHNTNLDGGTILSTWNLFEIILQFSSFQKCNGVRAITPNLDVLTSKTYLTSISK